MLPQKKPAPEPIHFICRELGIPVGKTVMVGDSPIDVETGRRAGTRTIALTEGFSPTQEVLDAGADLTLGAVADLLPIVHQA